MTIAVIIICGVVLSIQNSRVAGAAHIHQWVKGLSKSSINPKCLWFSVLDWNTENQLFLAIAAAYYVGWLKECAPQYAQRFWKKKMCLEQTAHAFSLPLDRMNVTNFLCAKPETSRTSKQKCLCWRFKEIYVKSQSAWACERVYVCGPVCDCARARVCVCSIGLCSGWTSLNLSQVCWLAFMHDNYKKITLQLNT